MLDKDFFVVVFVVYEFVCWFIEVDVWWFVGCEVLVMFFYMKIDFVLFRKFVIVVGLLVIIVLFGCVILEVCI